MPIVRRLAPLAAAACAGLASNAHALMDHTSASSLVAYCAPASSGRLYFAIACYAGGVAMGIFGAALMAKMEKAERTVRVRDGAQGKPEPAPKAELASPDAKGPEKPPSFATVVAIIFAGGFLLAVPTFMGPSC